MIALTHVTAVTLAGDPITDATIVVDGNRIQSVSPAGPVPAGAAVIDCTGKTAIPGLIDAHVHLGLPGDLSFDTAMRSPTEVLALRAGQSALRTLLSGTTTIRDAGGIRGIDFAMKKAIGAGQLPGPRMQVCGRLLVMTGGHGYFLGRECDGPDEVRKAAREQLKAGADWIKLMASAGFAKEEEAPQAAQLDLDELAVAVTEARKAFKPAFAHAHPAVAIKAAVRAGVASVEHCSFPDQEAIELLAERQIPMVPTFTVYWEMLRAGPDVVPPAVRRLVEAAWEEKLACFQRAVAAGVKVVAGTDSGPPAAPHGNIARELQLMVEAGLSPLQALEAATVNAAELLGLSGSVGRVAPGLIADVVVVNGNPLSDVRAVTRVHLVVKDGAVYNPAALRGALGQDGREP